VTDTTTPDDDFATLFAASEQAARIEPGRPVKGTIVALGSDVAFVNVGSKGEATIALDELRDDDGALQATVGDVIEATVISTTGGIQLSRKLQRGAATARQLEDAFRSGLPVEGKVEAQVKGGYSVTIARQRAFCPLSQIDTIRDTDASVHLGRVYTFKIVEYAEGGRKFVVSRRALLEAEQQVKAEEIRKSLAVGEVARGRVVSLRDFGAFVDLGAGVQGLLHVSEMAWSRVAHPSEVVAVGQEIAVKILRMDPGTGQIALGLKQLESDPWSTVAATFDVGDVREGRIVRIAEFGAFVELAPGVEGLAHTSTFPPTGRAGGWAKSLAVGQTGAFEILSIDAEKKRIGVAMAEAGSSRAEATAGSVAASRSAVVRGARLTGKVERHETFGVFVFLAPGLTGLVPASETGVGRDADLRKAFPVGAPVEVVVQEADPAGRRIRLSIKGVQEAEEAAEVRDYAKRADAEVSTSFGSLADKLRGALKSRR
jgi:small subunit ribosomal protein S1